MADTKITALAAIGANPIIPATFPIPMVDLTDTSMAASGTTKKVTVNQILGAGGTATLASASITGDLTVATSTLKVDSTNNRVGIGTTNTFKPLTVQAGSTGAATINQGLVINSSAAYGVAQGVSYSSLVFSRNRSVDTTSLTASAEIFGGNFVETSSDGGFLGFRTQNASGALTDRYTIDNTGISTWSVAGSTAMTLNSTGLGIGVVPSTHDAGKGLEVGALGNGLWCNNSTFNQLLQNATYNGGWKYAAAASTAASRLEMGGGFSFHIAPAGTAPNAITFTQAMTLDASGSLLIGTTSATVGATAARLHLSADGTDRWAVGPQSNSQHFIIQASNIYGVYLSSLTATSWSSASDERLKDVIEPISNAVSKVGSLRAVIGKFKSDKTNTRKPFLMAQDVLAVLPEAVDVSKPDQFGLAYTDVIPLLVAAIKELTARVQTLEAR